MNSSRPSPTNAPAGAWVPTPRPAPMLCPRCGSDRLSGLHSAQVTCGRCGGTTQADVLTVEPRRPVDRPLTRATDAGSPPLHGGQR